MKNSKWLVVGLFILLIIAAGVYYIFAGGKTSADALFNKSKDLTCVSKEVSNKVLFRSGNNLVLGSKLKALNATETPSPYGIFIKKSDQIYFTNGLMYSQKPDLPVSEYTTLRIGDIYYAAKHSAVTNISDLKITPNQSLYAYRESLYVVNSSEVSSKIQGTGYLYQKNGVTRMCASDFSYEFDVAEEGYFILTDGSIKYNYNITVLDSTGKELVPVVSSVSKKTYALNLNQTITIKENWTPSNPGGSAKLEYLSGKDNVKQLSTTSYRMIKYGITTLRITYTLPDGSEVSDEVTFDIAKG